MTQLEFQIQPSDHQENVSDAYQHLLSQLTELELALDELLAALKPPAVKPLTATPESESNI